jgi:hypothetical protein
MNYPGVTPIGNVLENPSEQFEKYSREDMMKMYNKEPFELRRDSPKFIYGGNGGMENGNGYHGYGMDDRIGGISNDGSMMEDFMPSHQRLPPPPAAPPVEHYEPPKLTCADVFDHISNCPVCSRIYQQDNTIYLIIIGVLTLMLVVLMKKILDGKL